MGEIVGILLAAGSGSRFDPSGRRLKLLEPAPAGPHAGKPMAEAAARNLRDALAEVIAVVRPAGDAVQRRLHEVLAAAGCRLQINDRADEGMGASLACGVAAAPDAAGWIIALADMPAIEPDSIRAVAQALREGFDTAAPFCGERRGHPVGFARPLYPALVALRGDAGARAVLAAHPPHRVDVADPGVLLDLDTVESFARA
ncbi:MAG TPA: nucleotidyltransferase family protein [Burkholderiaceae bacterium]|jgi:molybdenum cofactor cytidylyltransferase|nr:nucleotidyltransferase family protein [Burkholderiaceae bacterium]